MHWILIMLIACGHQSWTVQQSFPTQAQCQEIQTNITSSIHQNWLNSIYYSECIGVDS